MSFRPAALNLQTQLCHSHCRVTVNIVSTDHLNVKCVNVWILKYVYSLIPGDIKTLKSVVPFYLLEAP